MNIEKAISFIEENGTEIEKARIKYILFDEEPESSVVKTFIDLQNENGGFPFGLLKCNPLAIKDTLNAFLRMDELGMINTDTAKNAFQYIIGTQKDDGGWDENTIIADYNPPPWAVPGDIRARIYLTCQSAFWLAIGDYRDKTVFKKALTFLQKHQDESGRFFGFIHNTWIVTSVFIMSGDEFTDIVSSGIKALREKPLSEWIDSQIAWALQCFGKAGLPEDNPFVRDCLDE